MADRGLGHAAKAPCLDWSYNGIARNLSPDESSWMTTSPEELEEDCILVQRSCKGVIHEAIAHASAMR